MIAHLDLSANLPTPPPPRHTDVMFRDQNKNHQSVLSFAKDWKDLGGREMMPSHVK